MDPKGTLAISHKVAQLILGAVLGFVVQYIVDLIDVKIFRGSWSHWSDYVYSVVKEAWGAVSDSGFLKTIKVVAGMAVISEVLRCISKKVDFSIRNAFNKVIDAVIDFVLSSVLKIKSPKFIRDIKTKARNLGIKGTKKLTKFLNNEIFKVNLANITLSNLVSLIKEVVRKIFKNNSFKLVKY